MNNQQTAYYRNKRLHGGTFSNVFIYIDEKCNMHCKHCYLGDRLINHEEMSTDEIEKILNYVHLYQAKKCTIIGGEPTFSDNLLFTIKKINEFGMDCIVDTNGWFKSELLHQIDKDDLEYISFSLDAADSELHDEQRRANSFERTSRNITEAVKLGFEVRIIPTITRKNQHQAEDILKLADSLGISHVNFHTVTKSGNAKEQGDDFMLSPEEWIAFYRTVEQYRDKYKVKIWYPPTYAYEEDLLKYKQQGYIGCVGRTMDRISVFPGGSSYVCSLFFDEDKEHGGKTDGYFGKFEDQSFSINTDTNNELNHFFKYPEKCVGCKYIKNCHMGCPYEQSIAQEEFCGKDKPENKVIPMCRLWKAEVL